MRDGLIVRDAPISDRLSADTELRRLHEAQEAAQLTS